MTSKRLLLSAPMSRWTARSWIIPLTITLGLFVLSGQVENQSAGATGIRISPESVRESQPAGPDVEAALPVNSTQNEQPLNSLAHEPSGLPLQNSSLSPAEKYKLWAVAPAVVAIVVAIVTRQVLIALSLGILTASAMVVGTEVEGGFMMAIITWVTHALEAYLFGVLAKLDDNGTIDYEKLQIVVFTLFIGAMVGVIEANGGTRALVARVTRHMRTRSRGQIGAWLAGIIVFFDDYANAMIVGPSMRPLFDKLRLSREKLAYIVDSTAAPVASLFIGTWLVTEISYINEGLNGLGSSRPVFLSSMTGNAAFWASLPYRTYAWLTLAMVFLIGVLGRDFGPMRKAEDRALEFTGEADMPNAQRDSATQPSLSTPVVGGGSPPHGLVVFDDRGGRNGQGWWRAAVPIACLVCMTIGLLLESGYRACNLQRISLSFDSIGGIGQSVKEMMGEAASAPSLLYASLVAAVLAMVLSVGAIPLRTIMDGVSDGMTRMFTACIVLVLAWGLSQGMKDLALGDVASKYLSELQSQGKFSFMLLPAITFITAALVSFATGTSWGTMGILCPAIVTISARLLADMPEDRALTLFYATVGAVLTGAVFGDHCSPISDTTVLSSIASECDLTRHVWTQMPYAIVVAVVGILCTDLLNIGLHRWAETAYNAYHGWLVYAGTALGALVLLLIVLSIGRRPAIEQPRELHFAARRFRES